MDLPVSTSEIIERLKILNLEKIILFGSYARGTADENSDIDLCLVRKESNGDDREYIRKARKSLREIIMKHQIGFDILSITEKDLLTRQDYFYKNELLKEGKTLYAK